MGHNKIIKMYRFLTALLFVAFSGCIPFSENPLTEPETEKQDRSILGTWSVHDDDEAVYLHVGTDEDLKGFRLILVEYHQNGEVKASELIGHGSRIGDNTYLNLQCAQSSGEQKGYLFIKYHISGDRLGIAMLQSEAIQKVIQDGSLKGEISHGQWTSNIRITDSSKRLKAYFREHDNALFEDMKFLNRLTPSPESTNHHPSTP